VGAHTFLISNLFQRLLVCQMHKDEGFKFCLDTGNKEALPLDPACPERFSVLPSSQSTLDRIVEFTP
jgi:hypothetical protein